MESALRPAGVGLHSFKPSDTDRFRRAVSEQTRHNEGDAEGVARFGLALRAQRTLHRFRQILEPSAEL